MAGAVTEALAEFCQPVIYSSFERPVLCRRTDGEYLQVLSRHRRRELARRRRQLEAALGEVRAVDRSDEEAARMHRDFHLASLNHGAFIAPRGLIALSTVITDELMTEICERFSSAMADVAASG